MDEAIICTIKTLDKPMSPYAEAMMAWRLQCSGTNQSVHQQFRNEVLHCAGGEVRAAVGRGC